jgi:ribosome recycling factor
MNAIFTELEQKTKKAIEHLKNELAKLRGGRAQASLLDSITAEYYGSRTPLIQLGMISVPEARQITIQVYDPSAVDAVEKAIFQSDLGLTPSREGNLIRINIPSLTSERRQALIKNINSRAEEERVTVRGFRREALEKAKKQLKDKSISEDDLKRIEKTVQEITDTATKHIDGLVTAKEKEIAEV